MSTCCACVYRLLLDGMMIPRHPNQPNRSRRVFGADRAFKDSEHRRNELVEGGHRRPLSSEILPWWEHDMRWQCRPKRVPIRKLRLHSWYYLRRNSNLYDILFFREPHCTTIVVPFAPHLAWDLWIRPVGHAYADPCSLPKLFFFFFDFVVCRFCTGKRCFGYFRLWSAMRVLVAVLVRDWEKNQNKKFWWTSFGRTLGVPKQKLFW